MRRLLFACAIALPAWSAQPEFEVASIKPNTSPDFNGTWRFNGGGLFIGENIPLRFLVMSAFQMRDYQLSGLPGWVNQGKYDIQARGPGAPDQDRIAVMLQGLLRDRFHFEYHKVTKDGPIYALVAARGGIKLQESREGPCSSPASDKPETVACATWNSYRNRVDAKQITMAKFAIALSTQLDRPVVDRTGYTRTFDAHLERTPTEIAVDPRGEPGHRSSLPFRNSWGFGWRRKKGLSRHSSSIVSNGPTTTEPRVPVPQARTSRRSKSLAPSSLSQALDDVIEIIRGCVPFSQFEVR